MPTAEELGLETVAPATEPVAATQGATSEVPDDEKTPEPQNDPDKAPAPVDEPSVDSSDTVELDTSDGYTGPKSFTTDEPLGVPAHNAAGHRNVVCDISGNATVLDEDTARILYENPKFYEQIFHNGGSYPVERLSWADRTGNPVTVEKVGEAYEIGQ